MSRMIERAAKALCRATMNAPPERYPPGWVNRQVQRNWPLFIDEARTVIGAIREPSMLMTKAAQQTNNQYTPDKWRAMIDAILKEPKRRAKQMRRVP